MRFLVVVGLISLGVGKVSFTYNQNFGYEAEDVHDFSMGLTDQYPLKIGYEWRYIQGLGYRKFTPFGALRKDLTENRPYLWGEINGIRDFYGAYGYYYDHGFYGSSHQYTYPGYYGSKQYYLDHNY